MTGSTRSRSTRPHASVAGLVAVALFTGACLEPELVEEDAPAQGELPEIADERPADLSALAAELEALHASLTRIDGQLAAAADAEDVEEARAAGTAAIAALVDDPDLAGDLDIPGPSLLPGTTIDRSLTPESPAILITALAAAQEAGGELGRDATEVLAGPIAGDLGGWQRDAEGMVAQAADVAASGLSAADLGQLEQAVLDLVGEGPRALAWAFVVAGADNLELAVAAAERGRAHIGLMIDAVDDVLRQGRATTTDNP